MDYVDLVIHIFSKNARAYYDLERLWRDGKKIDAEKLIEEQAPKVAPKRRTKKVQ